MVMEVKPEQPEKALFPMIVTELGIMVLLHLRQLPKKEYPEEI